MPFTPKVAIPYPREKEDPYYTSFESMVQAIDLKLYAAREDKQIVLVGMTGATPPATFSWNSGTGTLQWDQAFSILCPQTGFAWVVPAGQVSMPTDGFVLYATLVRAPTSSTNVAFAAAASLPNSDEVYAIAVRLGSTIWFRSGQYVESGGTTILVVPSIVAAGNATQIQSRNVSNTAPLTGQVLRWGGSSWAPSFIRATPVKTKTSATSGNLAGVYTGIISINFTNTSTMVLVSGLWSDYYLAAGCAVYIESPTGSNDGVYGTLTSVVGATAVFNTNKLSAPLVVETASCKVSPIASIEAPVPLSVGDMVLVPDEGRVYTVAAPAWTYRGSLAEGELFCIASVPQGESGFYLIGAGGPDGVKLLSMERAERSARSVGYQGVLAGTGGLEVSTVVLRNSFADATQWQTNHLYDIEVTVVIRGSTYRASVIVRATFQTDGGVTSKLGQECIYHGGTDGTFNKATASGTDYAFDLDANGESVELSIMTPNATSGGFVADVKIITGQG